MTTNFHTPIPSSPPQEATAAVFNSRFGTLDAAIDDNRSLAVGSNAELVAARSPYASLKARLDAMTGGYAGGNIATLANGAASAGQKVVTVDSTTGFLAGAYAAYYLVSGIVEYNLIASVDGPTQLTLTTNIGATGIANNSYVGLISVSEYEAANAIPHAGTLTLPKSLKYANADVYHVDAYGAADGTDSTSAFEAAITAIKARSQSKVKNAILRLTPGANYTITDSLDLSDISHVVIDGGSSRTTITYADANVTSTQRVLFDCLGAARLVFQNFTVIGDSTSVPAAFFSLGRSTDTAGEDSGQHVISNVSCQGYWSKAAIYNVASELLNVQNCWIMPSGPSGCKYGIFASGYNDESVGSSHATRSTTVSMSCVWIQNCNIGQIQGGPTAYIPIKLGREAGSVAIRDCYAFVYNDMPVIQFTGNCYDITIDSLLCEGDPDKTVHFSAYSGSGTANSIRITNVNLGTYGTVGISQDAGTTIRGLLIDAVRGAVRNSNPLESAIEFKGTVYAATINKWWIGEDGAATFYDLIHSKLAVANHTMTFTGTNKALGSEIHSWVTGTDHYTHQSTAFRIGTVDDDDLAQIHDIRTASKSWSPGAIADDGTASTTVDIAGVTQADGWVCQASFTGLVGAAGWEISAVGGDSVVGVVIRNRTGGSLTPTGTLKVVAWKVNAV